MPERELVLAVPAALLPAPQDALVPFSPELYDLLRTGGRFLPRDEVETDETHRQVIAYALVRHKGRSLLMRRTRAGADARLHDRHSLGVGGHVNPVDAGDDPIRAALARELTEEIECQPVSVEPLGFIHRSGSPVERVHTGVLFLVESETEPRIRETHKLEGRLATLAEIQGVRDSLEGWSLVPLEWLEAHDQA